MYLRSLKRTGYLGQPIVTNTPSNQGVSPEWARLVRQGIDIVRGRAVLEDPRVMVTTGEEPTVAAAIKNPIVWIALTGLIVALLKR